ncbi:MAG: GNAT family N-acetyltransferase [Proteobacteria bacterium]|nr:GNAT family N-acetyltransferase [Pseudomonadota bacterium]
MKISFHNSIEEISKKEWDSLLNDTNYPFLKHEFLSLLENTSCVGAKTGWIPLHITISRENSLLAAMPLYLKSHSQGEFVFDHSWANAFYQHGLDYYPKLVSSIPHTPASGPRLLIREGENKKELFEMIKEGVKNIAAKNNISSWHILFPKEDEVDFYDNSNLSIRKNAQFIWFNENFKSFEDYINSFRARHRKNVKKERDKIKKQELIIETFSGEDLNYDLLNKFYKFYLSTNIKRSGFSGYLTKQFFLNFPTTLFNNLVIVFAKKKNNDEMVGGSLFFRDDQNLYGRYWGCIEEFDCLHFECCYYQGIDYCIKNKLQKFDPGVQGEHKIKRGFSPTETYSAHWIADERFREAIEDFVNKEERHINYYLEDAKKLLPFKTS